MATEQGALALMGLAFFAGGAAAVAVRAVIDWWQARSRPADLHWDV
jgi:hypothetical protein